MIQNRVTRADNKKNRPRTSPLTPLIHQKWDPPSKSAFCIQIPSTSRNNDLPLRPLFPVDNLLSQTWSWSENILGRHASEHSPTVNGKTPANYPGPGTYFEGVAPFTLSKLSDACQSLFHDSSRFSWAEFRNRWLLGHKWMSRLSFNLPYTQSYFTSGENVHFLLKTYPSHHNAIPQDFNPFSLIQKRQKLIREAHRYVPRS